MAKLLALPKPPTAVMCCNDMAAIGALKTLHARGLRAGRDIALIGFDDLTLCNFTQPPLTTIRFSPRELADLSFRALLEEIHPEKGKQDYEYKTRFMLRNSTGPPRTSTFRRIQQTRFRFACNPEPPEDRWRTLAGKRLEIGLCFIYHGAIMGKDRTLSSMRMGRRGFLKGSGLAIAGTAIGAAASASESPAVRSADTAEATRSGIGAANPLQGTNSTFRFSRGNTLPIAARPFGMAHWTIQSAEDTAWMFDPWARRIQGFRCTHQLSPWLADYGYAVFLPISGHPKPAAEARSSSWRPVPEELTPHSFRLDLLRYQLQTEPVPTERCAAIAARHIGPLPGQALGFVIEVPGRDVAFELQADKQTVRFTSKANGGGVPANFATYYVLTFTRPYVTHETASSERATTLTLHMAASEEEELTAHIATSFISFEQAERNLVQEIGSKSLNSLRDEALQQWQTYAGRIEIAGGTERQQRIFYSCVYRTLLFPHTWHELDAAGQPHHFSAYDGKVHAGVMYADHGYWDVYRAWYPMMSIVYPERLAEILQAWVNAYKEGLAAAVPLPRLSRLHDRQPHRRSVRRCGGERPRRLRSRYRVRGTAGSMQRSRAIRMRDTGDAASRDTSNWLRSCRDRSDNRSLRPSMQPMVTFASRR